MKTYIEEVRDRLAEEIDVEGDLLDLYTLLVFVKGRDCTLENVHDAWSIWRNKTNSAHKSLIPFRKLTDEVQELDREYTDAIIRASGVL